MSTCICTNSEYKNLIDFKEKNNAKDVEFYKISK